MRILKSKANAFVAALVLTLFVASSASADWLVHDATIVAVRAHARTSFAYWFSITVTGGTGPCANSTIQFKRTGSPNDNDRVGAELMLSAALAAKLAGLPVDVAADSTSTSCSDGDTIIIE
jgi:hypothetical protein